MPAHRPARLSRLLIVPLLLLGLLAATAPSGRAAASEESAAAVDGRLGGSMQSFIDRFGNAVSYISAMGPQYQIEGYGYVTIYVEGFGNEPEEARDPDARVNRINVSSPRPLDRGASDADPADWSLAEATERVRELLPADAELAEWSESEDGQRSAVCESAALTEIYADHPALLCRVMLITPTPESVSFAIMTISTSGEPEQTEPAVNVNPCAGAVDWIQGAGERLAAMEALIGQVATIDESDPAAVETLRGLAQSLRDLAADQRAIEAPEVAAQASYYLIQALTTYANAIDTAADGVEQQDQTLVDDAVGTFEQAGGLVAKVTDEIESAGEVCALQLGAATPSASPEP